MEHGAVPNRLANVLMVGLYITFYSVYQYLIEYHISQTYSNDAPPFRYLYF